jgi:hypothetical protein
MAGWLDQGSAPGGLAPLLVYGEIAAGLAVVATVLHFRRRRGTAAEFRAVRVYFAAWAVLLLAVPCATIAATANRPLEALAGFGLTLGRRGLGLGLAGIGLLVAVGLALLLPLVPVVGLIPALAGQTLLSTLLHMGHPRCEVLAAVGGGLALGLVAYATGSFVYTLIIHAAAGISVDVSLYFGKRRAAR